MAGKTITIKVHVPSASGSHHKRGKGGHRKAKRTQKQIRAAKRNIKKAQRARW